MSRKARGEEAIVLVGKITVPPPDPDEVASKVGEPEDEEELTPDNGEVIGNWICLVLIESEESSTGVKCKLSNP